MRRINRFRPSPAAIIACIALLVALGGVGYAATPDTFRAAAAGPGDAYVGYNDGPVTLPSGQHRKLVKLSLPKGKYIVWAKVHLFSTNGGNPLCTLTAGPNDDESRGSLPSTGGNESLTNSVGATFDGPGKAVFECWIAYGNGSAAWAKVTATRVANLTITPSS